MTESQLITLGYKYERANGARAQALRQLADDPAARAALGARGQAKARASLGVESLAAALRGFTA